MKTIKGFVFRKFISVLFIAIPILSCVPSFAQIIVPKGWENEDSLRIAGCLSATWRFGWTYGQEDESRIGRLQDSLGINMDFWYGNADVSLKPLFGGRQKGYYSYFGGLNKDLPELARNLIQRIYYPSPVGEATWWDGGYRWRYIDTVHYTWNENRYDANDISPFAEFDKDTNFVKQKYFSRMKSQTGDSLTVGTDGRLILGYNDNRRADQMFRATTFYPFGSLKTLARAFSARLEFNVDTALSSMDTLHTTLSSDSIPLLKVQILFKRGNEMADSGKSIFPFVPFKKTPYASDSGWYAILDSTITPKIYHKLRYSWRIEDSLANGTPAHQDNWKFKQINFQLKNLPKYIDTLIDSSMIRTGDDYWRYGTGSQDLGRISMPQNMDSLVQIDSSDSHYINTSLESPTAVPLVEIRLLSTYRAKIRIRSLSWQDTVEDKFLYRARYTNDSTHSLNPDGSYGGMDDSVKISIESFASAAASSGTKIREMFFNDVAPFLFTNQLSGLSYIDHMISKSGFHIHMRPQDGGEMFEILRRERLGYDGLPPSVVENQYHNYYSQKAFNGFFNASTPIQHVFPGDYYPASALGSGSAWLHNSLDTSMGMLIARPGDTSDYYKAYRTFVETEEMQGMCSILRSTAYTALHHPIRRRGAVESSAPIWGGITAGAYKSAPTTFSWVFPHDTLHQTIAHHDSVTRISTFASEEYFQRPTTPEENNGFFYICLANGYGSIDINQFIDGGNSPGGGTVTTFGVTLRSSLSDLGLMDYSYNWGHLRTCWDTSQWLSPNYNVVDSVLPKYYLGLSNQFRALYRVESRINQIYDTLRGNKYPFKHFTWLDAYSTHKAIQTKANTVQDTLSNPKQLIDTSCAASFRNAFLKCTATTQVKLWDKGSHGEYLDSTQSGNLVADSARRTYVEVGLFIDSTNPVQKNYAALVVNTRLYPDHKTGDDSVYYCQGLSSQDRPHSLFGDIAVRKVFLKIDTLNIDPLFRAVYYVVNDLWHPDSSWLVKNDSSFAIYLKPGDAKFLYITPSISIKVAPTATVSSGSDFMFNNGRRVCERMGGTRTVETYTRGGKLYVSNASRGTTIPGYGERSDGDNIATGNEICIDTSSNCHRPSICVGRDDKSVGIVYWKAPNQIWAAYQADPDSAWHLAQNLLYSCIDSSADYSWVTPVLAPTDDTTWIVAAGYRRDPTDMTHTTSGIVGARFRYEAHDHSSPHIVFLSDNFTYLATDRVNLDTALNSQSYFPTITSRPMLDSLFPVRMAYQKGQPPNSVIMSERIAWTANPFTPPTIEAPVNISAGLQSDCYNAHPNIAMYGVDDPWHGAKPLDSSFQVFVTWESKLFGQPKSNLKYFPILRQYGQRINQVAGTWRRQFNIFIPDTLADDNFNSFRYPLVSANNRIGGKVFNSNPRKATPAYHDFIRMLWGNLSGTIQMEHWENGWIQGWLKTTGQYPSIGQTTDTVTHWTNATTVPRSMVYARYGSEEVKITNGWSPWVDFIDPRLPKTFFQVGTNDSLNTCNFQPPMHIVINPPIVYIPTGGGSITKYWSEIDPADASILDGSWSVTPSNPVEIHSDSILLHAGDSLYINRTVSLSDSTAIRNALLNTDDTLSFDLVLRNFADSSVIATIEHSFIDKNAMKYPNYGLDSAYAKYKYPTGSPTSFTFLTAEIKRTKIDNLTSNVIELDAVDSLPLSSFKKAARPQSQPVATNLNVDVVPNPFNHSTSVQIQSTEGLLTRVEVFDGLGKKVAELFNSDFPAGMLDIRFEPTMLSSGFYYIRVVSGRDIVTKKIELLK